MERKNGTEKKAENSTLRLRTKKITRIGLMAAVFCVLGPLSIPIPFSPVPITLTNFALFIAVYVLGMKEAAQSFLVYLLLGAVGLPVFSGFSGGLAKLTGPTGGYLIGFIFLALIHGFFLEHFSRKAVFSAVGMVLGMAVSYLLGTLWLSALMSLTFLEGLAMGVIPYLAGDTVKIILALIIGPKLARATASLRNL